MNENPDSGRQWRYRRAGTHDVAAGGSGILIDAGTGVGDLTFPELRVIDHVFLTHSHLDHVAMLPFLLDTVGADRERPVKVHVQEATLN
jgi:glyoxylase-like metal-dependent hydrolase (beta-lactamase superfamily II)